MKHPQFIHLLSGAGRTCPGPISYHAAACPSRGGQWRGLVSHSGVKAEVLLGAAVGESANSNWQRSCLVGGKRSRRPKTTGSRLKVSITW